MDTEGLGDLERVELRDQWQNEARDFTPWLAANIQVLGSALGMSLEVEAQEKEVGPFRADILCQDTSEAPKNMVLVENQLEKTNHTHLGQILTYAAGLQTATIVWVASEFTDEHRAALDWLNEVTDTQLRFFGLEIELWRIGDSARAPKLNVVARPNDWTRGVRNSARADLSATQMLQLDFWNGFSEHLSTHSTLKGITPRAQHYMSHAIGRSGCSLSTVFATWSSESEEPGELRVELTLTGSKSDHFYGQLTQIKDDIEQKLGTTLTWHRPEGKTMRRLYQRLDADPNDQARWPDYYTWLRERLEKFHSVLQPIVGSLNADDAPPETMDADEGSGEAETEQA
jgi:hypothetical protein